MTIFIRLLLSLMLAATVSVASAAVDSRGKEFMFAFPPNYTNSGNLSLFISSETSAAGTVEIQGLGFVEAFNIEADTIHEVKLPVGAQVSVTGSVQEKGIRVVSDSDISIYALNQYPHTTDAFLVLPVDTLGMEYLNVSYTGIGGMPSQMLVTGVYDGTEVTITTKVATTSHKAGDSYTVTLNSGQSYLVSGSSTNDLTGSELKSTAPVSVQGAVKCVYIPVGYAACDHIVEMLQPVSTLGRSFLTVPLATRKRGDVFRVIASENATEIYIDGELESIINRGDFYEMILTQKSQIETTKPAYLAQYSPGQNFDHVTSDPFMMLIPPSEQFLDHYNFISLGASVGFKNSFVNVVAPASAISGMFLDGELVNESLFEVIGDSGYLGAQIPVADGAHNLVASEAFGIYVYGFGSADSYGYPGGMSFDMINPRGDVYAPGVRLELIGDYIVGYATDSEDANANKSLDVGEDLNANGVIDRRSEDLNNNGLLDDGEDLNGNGVLDRDQGVFRIELSDDSDNLLLETDRFVPGSTAANFVISRIDASQPASGTLNVLDGAGNTTSVPIVFFSKPYLSTVSVVSTFSNNQLELVQDSFNKTPVRIEDLGDRTEVEWQYDQFPADQTDTLMYDLIMRDPVPGETRLVLHDLVLSYADVNGNPVVISLGTRAVTVAPSMLNLATATDKIRYRAGETVAIQTPVQNLGDMDDSARLVIRILDSEDALVAVVADQTVSVIVNSTLLVDDTPFDLGNIATGSYRVQAQLLNASDEVLRQAEAPFLVVTDSDDLIDLDSSVYTQQPTYSPWDKVDITAGLQNMASNSTVGLTNLELKVRAPDGQVLLTEQKTLNSIAPAAVHRYSFYLQLDDAVSGDYQVSWKALDEDGQAVTSAMTTFRVEVDAIQALVGLVTAADDRIYHTGTTQCQFQISNRGSDDAGGLEYATTLVQLDSQLVISRDEASGDIGAGTETNWTLDIEAEGKPYGGYSCILEVKNGDSWQVLASDNFEIQTPAIDVGLATGERGRVLVLTDAEPVCKGLESIDFALTLNNELAVQSGWEVELVDVAGGLVRSSTVYANGYGRANSRHSSHEDEQQADLSAQVGPDGRLLVNLSSELLADGYILTVSGKSHGKGQPAASEQQWSLATHCDRSFDTSVIDDGLQLLDWTMVRADDSRVRMNQVSDVNLEQQNQWLYQLLTDSGWEITLVHTADDFALQHRLGDYSSYLLLANRVQLPKTILKELREAVFAGKGLVVANGFGHRNYWLEPALGSSTLGHGTRATSIDVLASDLSEAWSGVLPVDTALNTLKVNAADTLAVFAGDTDENHCYQRHDHEDEHGSSHGNAQVNRNGQAHGNGHTHHHQRAAITGYQYGAGGSLLFGFDLLRQAYTDGADGQYSKLLTSALAEVSPSNTFIHSGAVQPVWVEWQNRRGAVDVVSTLSLPVGSELLVNGSFSDEQGSWVSRFHMDEQQIQRERLYVRLDDTDLAQAITIDTYALDGDQQTEQQQAVLELAVLPTPAMADTRVLLENLAASYWYRLEYRKMVRTFDKVESMIAKQKWYQAETSLLQIADDLMQVDEADEDAVVAARQQLQRHIQWIGQQLAQ
ncbi:IgGFc-binding protein [Oceanobacter mangrovi]|uniref:IgGFc-binding protein n=1 Tax=Oceanobacter mangrovi TaxID=2862510 RepID=UPI001C8D8DD0|nr:IgGFc-binding protein [Oceanobacter mangrovi]